MIKKNATVYFVLVVVGILITSCISGMPKATTATEIGAVSRITAENSYQAIVVAHASGVVSKEDMATADKYYEMWAAAQVEYVNALKSGVMQADKAKQVQYALNLLLGLATQYALL